MSAEFWFVLRCLDMKPGDSSEYPPGGYTVHKYPDVWWILWTNPTRCSSLGKEFADAIELRKFLAGDNNAGNDIYYRED